LETIKALTKEAGFPIIIGVSRPSGLNKPIESEG